MRDQASRIGWTAFLLGVLTGMLISVLIVHFAQADQPVCTVTHMTVQGHDVPARVCLTEI